MVSDGSFSSDERSIDDWLKIAETKINLWEPSPLNDLLRTDRRDAYQSLLANLEYSLGLLRDCLVAAKKRPAPSHHIQNIEAPGGCWESGTQIMPGCTKAAPPDGPEFVLYDYQLVYILTRALVLDEEDMVRHMCNNRACIRPDHLEIGTAQQNLQDEERRKYAGNTPEGRKQTLHAHVPRNLQRRPDPWVPEPLEREKRVKPPAKPKPNA